MAKIANDPTMSFKTSFPQIYSWENFDYPIEHEFINVRCLCFRDVKSWKLQWNLKEGILSYVPILFIRRKYNILPYTTSIFEDTFQTFFLGDAKSD